MSDQYLGEIRLVGFNFAPVGWALCNGATLSISQNAALFSLLGTTYGGNGTTTFNIPDLQGRVVIGSGNGAGLSSYSQGQIGGAENVAILAANMPAHTHTVSPSASTANATSTSPAGGVPAVVNDGTRQQNQYPGYDSSANTTLAASTTSVVGGSVPITNIQPYLSMYYIIAVEGIFPARN